MARPDQLDSLLGYQLRRASSLLMTDLVSRLAALDLRPAEASVLVVLYDHSLTTQSEIGRRLSIKRANMAPLIAGLVGRGLVERADPVGRGHPLRLSRAGRALAAAAAARMTEHDADFFGDLDADERERLRRFLTKLWQGGQPAA